MNITPHLQAEKIPQPPKSKNQQSFKNPPTPNLKNKKILTISKNKIQVQNGGTNQKAKNTRKHQKLIKFKLHKYFK